LEEPVEVELIVVNLLIIFAVVIDEHTSMNIHLAIPIVVLCIAAAFFQNNKVFQSHHTFNRVRAFDDLSVDFNVPSGSPLFTIPDMKPGDPSYTRTITVRNSGQVRRMISVRGIRTGGTTMLPNIEHVLEIIISSGGIDIYGGSSPTGAKTVEQFFTDSFSATGILLGIINPSQSLPL
jgi:hypothetical protein